MSATKFSQINYTLTTLLDQIELGSIGLPDIQRPFVWPNRKIRNLFDSMYRGYPVGYFLFWQTGADVGAQQVGAGRKQVAPQMLIVDGQQRLTSLFAVLKGIEVVDSNYQQRQVEISFRPADELFEVGNAATKKDPEFISNISQLWEPNGDIFSFVSSFLSDLESYRKKNGKTLDPEERKQIQKRINKLYNLNQYPFTALVLSELAEPEEVSDVFVRINSAGEALDQADFILTLMSVYWDEGRTALETFSKESRKPSTRTASAFNHFIKPGPDQLLRVSVGLGFNRAVLKYAYALLRGKDLETKESSPEIRDKQFAILQKAQSESLNLQNWHDFFKVLQQAGFRSSKMISSKNALIYCYTLYLIGKCRYKVDKYQLAEVVARWFFMVSLTGRYSSSPESVMERDLRDVSQCTDADGFVSWVDERIAATLTEDFWNISLPNMLVTAAATGPAHYAYYASLNLLDAKVLYSKKRVFDLLDPAHKAIKAGVEKHHLFPKSYLKKAGVTKQRRQNQFANYALVEWDDNNAISNKAPSDYAPVYEARLSDKEKARMRYWHALPLDWYKMEYTDFVQARRKLMAKVIRDGFEKLTPQSTDSTKLIDEPVNIAEIIKAGEGTNTEFKSTLRVNLHTNEKDPKMEHAALKTLAAFLNSQGGTLVIGVDDEGKALGLEHDKFPNEDKMNLHLVNIIKKRIGAEQMLHIRPQFTDLDGKRVLVVACKEAYTPVYLKDKQGTEQFYIRTGAATSELVPSQIQTYIQQRF